MRCVAYWPHLRMRQEERVSENNNKFPDGPDDVSIPLYGAGYSEAAQRIADAEQERDEARAMCEWLAAVFLC